MKFSAVPIEQHTPVNARILFVNHTSVLGGGEYVLLSIVRMFGPGSALWMFQDGPLRAALPPGSVRPMLPRVGAGMASIKRDRSMLASVLPHGWSILSMCFGIAGAARRFAGAAMNAVASRRRRRKHRRIAAILRPVEMCRRGGSNPYTLRYGILSPARLPVPPLLRRRAAIGRSGRGDVNERALR